MWTPVSAMLGGRSIAVLRAADQRAQRSPTVCVRSGRPTAFATTSTVVALRGGRWWEVLVGHALTDLIGRLARHPRLEVVLAVDEPFWRQWRARLTFAVAIAAAGCGIALVGLVAGTGVFVGFGVFLLVAGWFLRVRALLQCWVSLDYDAAKGFVRVFRAHSAFDQAARALFATRTPRDRR